MPSTNSLNRTVDLARAFCSLRPLTNIGGATNEPAFSIGDWVRNFIIGPPFSWRWNRSIVPVTLVAGQQDYVTTVENFGWLEQASIQDNTLNPSVIQQLNIALKLSESTVQETPTHVSAQFDNDDGTITFRFLPVPPKAYSGVLTYQESAPMFASIEDSWEPIPDYLSYLVNQGFIAKSYEFINDERWGPAMQLFVRQVIAANDGLSDSQVSLFLGERLNAARQQQNVLGNNQAARQGRGAF